MFESTIHPSDFASDSPPSRIIGTEFEANVNLPISPLLEGGYTAENHDYISDDARDASGLEHAAGFIVPGFKLYADLGHIEICTPACLGPRQAAAADLAGINILNTVVDASEVPHNGVFRVTGMRKNGETRTSGFHENFMIPANLVDSTIFQTVMASHLASRTWAMAGGLTIDGYSMSQKVSGIGDSVLIGEYGERTVERGKPLAITTPPSDDVVDGDYWSRFEVRYADGCQSPTGRFASLAATSLVLRLVENEHKLGDARELADYGFREPVNAARGFSKGVLANVTYESNIGADITALDYQELLIENAYELAELVDLPEDELEALGLWADIVDRLNDSSPDSLDFGGLEYELDFAARYFVMAKRIGHENIHAENPEAQHISLKWDQINPLGVAQAWWEKFSSEHVTQSDIEIAATVPPETRAKRRTDAIRHRSADIESMTWSQIKLNSPDAKIDLSDPYYTGP